MPPWSSAATFVGPLPGSQHPTLPLDDRRQLAPLDVHASRLSLCNAQYPLIFHASLRQSSLSGRTKERFGRRSTEAAEKVRSRWLSRCRSSGYLQEASVNLSAPDEERQLQAGCSKPLLKTYERSEIGATSQRLCRIERASRCKRLEYDGAIFVRTLPFAARCRTTEAQSRFNERSPNRRARCLWLLRRLLGRFSGLESTEMFVQKLLR